MLRYEVAGGDQQRPLDRAEFGPHLVHSDAVPRRAGVDRARRRNGERGEAGVARAPLAGEVDQVGGGREDHGGGSRGAPFQQVQDLAAGPFRVPPGVPGHHQGHGASAQREGGAGGRVEAVGVDDVRPRAGGPQGGDGGRVAAPGHREELRPGGREVVGAVHRLRGADGHPHPARHQPGGQRTDVRAAARTAAAQDLDRTQL